jgi:hypothetical protein
MTLVFAVDRDPIYVRCDEILFVLTLSQFLEGERGGCGGVGAIVEQSSRKAGSIKDTGRRGGRKARYELFARYIYLGHTLLSWEWQGDRP